MDFNNKPPKWNAEGREPSITLQNEGFKAGYKPPAPFFNYLFNKLTASINEIQSGLSNVDNTADKDKPISTKQQAAIDNNVISGIATGNPIIITDAAAAPYNDVAVKGASVQDTTTGKNLCPRFTGSTKMGVTLNVNSNGSITLDGTATGGSFSEVVKTNIPAGKYIFSANNPSAVGTDTTTAPYIAFRNDDMDWLMTAIFKDKNKKQTFETTTEITSVLLAVPEGVTLDNFTLHLQVEQGSTATDYEPYTGGKPSPSPEYPQVINSVGDSGSADVKSCCKSLVKNTATTQTKNGITFTVNEDGTVTVNGTATADASLFVFTNLQNVLKVGEQYILNGCPSGCSTETCYMEINHIWYGDIGNGAAFTYKDGITGCYIVVRSGVTVTNKVFKPMIRLASVEDDTYEPHTGTTATVPLAEPLYGTNTMRLSGTTKRYASITFTGADGEGWNIDYTADSTKRRMTTSLLKDVIKKTENTQIANIWCNTFLKARADDTYSMLERISVDDLGRIHIYSENYNDVVADWCAFLANNPMTVIYELADPVTEELTEEQRIALQNLQSYEGVTNVFADELASLEVEYFKNTDNGKAASKLKAENNKLWQTLGNVNSVLESLIGGA